MKLQHVTMKIDSDQATGAVITATDETGCIAGCLVLDLNDPAATVKSLFVHAEFRKKGLGKRLLDRAKSIGKAHKKTALLLVVKDTNEQALKLYRKAGFVPIADWTDEYKQYVLLL